MCDPASGGAPKQLAILLHGWGADGPNLIDLADMFAPVLPDALFVAPNAPYRCEANPYGYQWFSLMDRQPQHMLAGARNAADILNHFIDHALHDLGLDNSKLILIGFSQGTMTALHVAMRREPAIGAVVGFSGAMVGAEVLAAEIKAKPPVCLIHGEADDVVPFASMKLASEALLAQGVNVETHPRPFLGHSIDMDGLKAASNFLKKTIR
ncbi:MAG: dienelactone hydrolase family protein [Rickettsiales bacterium]|nr:dienelactone hydrolase family protein [Rickettsiales bacterium]